VVDVNLVRDKTTGKSRGFAFLAYEDQRSTVLAVGEDSLRFLLKPLPSVVPIGSMLRAHMCSYVIFPFILCGVDNLNGAKVLGRIIKVDHVDNYKKKEEEDEDELAKKREERGVCYAFQKGECNRGDACRFSHDEQVQIPACAMSKSLFDLSVRNAPKPLTTWLVFICTSEVFHCVCRMIKRC
jgi:RNA-binding motif X-linked protein 2